MSFVAGVKGSLASTAVICLITLNVNGCSNDAVERYYKAQREAQKQADAQMEIEKKEHAYATPLDFAPISSVGLKSIPIALIDPIVTISRCQGDFVLVSLPDEIACEDDSKWIYQPSQRTLPPAELLLVSLRFTGLSVSPFQSLTDAKQAGAKIAILPVITQADAKVLSLKSYYEERRIDAKDESAGAHSRIVATVKVNAVVVRIDSGQVVWKGPVEQDMEFTVLALPFSDGRARIESAAGSGTLEPQAYGIRSVVVQAYTRVAQSLVKNIDGPLNELVR